MYTKSKFDIAYDHLAGIYRGRQDYDAGWVAYLAEIILEYPNISHEEASDYWQGAEEEVRNDLEH